MNNHVFARQRAGCNHIPNKDSYSAPSRPHGIGFFLKKPEKALPGQLKVFAAGRIPEDQPVRMVRSVIPCGKDGWRERGDKWSRGRARHNRWRGIPDKQIISPFMFHREGAERSLPRGSRLRGHTLGVMLRLRT